MVSSRVRELDSGFDKFHAISDNSCSNCALRACVESWLGQKGFEIRSKVLVLEIADLIWAKGLF
jgi:hypothetical protein